MLNIILLLTLGISLYTDLTQRKIYNWITVPAMALGLILNTWQNGFDGFMQAWLGWAVGLLIFFIPFLLGGISAGDIKLLAAVGALKGPEFIIEAVLLTALVGGIYVLIYLIVNKKLLHALYNLKRTLYFALMALVARRLSYMPNYGEEQAENVYTCSTMPYGVAIFTGTLLTLVLG
ncbi:MAG TPA: prepilin peptidase [Clostridia bacterium]|jgi:prepilin peptidase CpaA|nr:prepilin peptidase [Clostridia bacterium]